MITSLAFCLIFSTSFTFNYIKVLDLGGNNLQILPREVFSRHGLLNLQKLKLSNCKIGQIDPTAFRGRLLFRMSFIFEMIKCLICSGLTNLVELDLSSNKLASVPTPTFSGKIVKWRGASKGRVSLLAYLQKLVFQQSRLYDNIFEILSHRLEMSQFNPCPWRCDKRNKLVLNLIRSPLGILYEINILVQMKKKILNRASKQSS